MAFNKIVKNKAYFKRFQVKYRRRRECKTDYYARKRLIVQDKNKYGTPKYRFVVRITNRDIICQIFSAELTHDVCHAAAYSHELKRYGINYGLTNYAAAYATGLLLARRVNDKFKLPYEGVTEANGERYLIEKDGDKAPFKAYFDIGLQRTTTGARIFGALKGAVDGGLDIPHNERRFPGSSDKSKPFTYAEDKETGVTEKVRYTADPETHRKYILGGHVAEYMDSLDDETRAKRFSRLEAAGISGEDLEGLYTAAHAAIRKEPFKARDATEKGYFLKRESAKAKDFPKKQWQQSKLTASQRHNRIVQVLTNKNVAPTLVKA